MLNAFALRRENDILAAGYERGRRFQKNEGIGWHVVVHFHGMRAIISANGDNFGWQAGKQELYLGEIIGFLEAAKLTKGVTLDHTHSAIADPAKLGGVYLVF